MSNRLTFSLASLVLIFALAFVAMPAMAADGGPTVTITDAGTTATPSTRAVFLLKFTFSHSVSGFTDLGDATFQMYDKTGTLLGNAATTLTPAAVTGKPREYTATADVSTEVTAVGFRVTVPANAATGNTTANSLGNQMNHMDFDLPPLVATGSLTLSVAKASTQDPATEGDDYVLTVAYKTGSPAAAATPSTVPTVDNLTFDPAYLGLAVLNGATGDLVLKTGDDAADGLYDLPIVHPTGAPTVTIGVQPSYIKGVKTVMVPLADPVHDRAPMVTMAVSGLDEEEREFRVDVTITPQAKSDGSAGDKVTTAKGWHDGIIKATGMDDAEVTLTAGDESVGDNMYRAFLTYDRFAKLPLTLSLDPNDIDAKYKASDDVPDVDPVTAMVGDPGTTPGDPPANAPAKPAAPTAMIDTANDLIINVSWTAPDDNGSAITGYTVKKFDSDGMLVKTFPETGDDAITGTTLAVGPVPAADRGMSFTFTVMATNANGNSAESEMSDAVMVPEAPAAADKPPFFPADASIDPIKIWAGLPFVSQVLPKASAVEGIDYLYKVREVGGDKGDPQELPGGFQLINNDVEDRTLQIQEANKADSVPMSKTNYEYIAYEKGNATNESKPVKFSIEVIAPIKPTAPTAVMAMEEGDLGSGETDPLGKAAANIVRTENSNKVVVDWTAPVDGTMGLSPPHDEIPFGAPITHYMVYQTYKEDGAKVTYPRPNADKIKGTDTSYTTPVLSVPGTGVGRGMYGFEVAAVNTVGTGAKSTPSADTLVADPPNPATDLRASKVPTDPNSTTLDWLVPTDDGGLPNDDDISIRGYIIYRTLDGGPEIEFEIGPVVTYRLNDLDAGRHVFRIAAFNSDGLGRRSISTAFAVDVPLDPTTPANVKPTFGNETIDNITATVGTAIESVTLPAATDPDGDDGNITYSLSPNPRLIGLTFNAATRFLSGTPTRAQSARTYTYTATDARGETAPLNFTLTVNAATQPPRPTPTGDLNATRVGNVVTINFGSIGMHDFATIGSQDLPDLEEFFDLGGVIDLSDGDATDDKNSRVVVISEILWGNDLGAPVEEQSKWQFIELYNTTGASINLAGWTLTFTEGRPSPFPKIDIDQVSNRRDAGWNLDKGGTHGQTGRVTGTLATDLTSAITPTNIISMYRNIDYDKVEKIHDANNATENRKKQLDGFPSGNASGSWLASQRRSEYNRWIYDSKWGEHFKPTAILTKSPIARTPFVINEIGNGPGDTNDWVELRNVTTGRANLKKRQLSYVSGFDKDTSLVKFPDKDLWVPAGKVILLVNTDPKNTKIAAGRNIAVAVDDQELTGATNLYYVDANLKLPDDGKFNLILRTEIDKLKASSHFMDVVGGLVVVDDAKATSQWPLIAHGAPGGNSIKGHGRDLKSGYVYGRNKTDAQGDEHIVRAGYTGVGYDRVALRSDANGGTPGYDNGAVKDKIKDGTTVVLTDGEITFSEIMLDTGPGKRLLPQWIELYNSSMTQAVNLNGWKLTIENSATDEKIETRVDATITLKAMTIAPNQTVLIITTSGRNSDPDHFPSTRVVNLWTDKDHRNAIGTESRTQQVFSAKGLYLKLSDTKGNPVDEFGNLDGLSRTRTQKPGWEFPMNRDNGDDRRSSLIRRYTNGKVHAVGTTKGAWRLASGTNFADLIGNTYYGDPDDFGTPGFRGGGPLPVSLSSFRPARMKDTGEVVVRWITESELNNAGFNILRSDKRDGEFTKVHYVAGQGTTSERTVYEWKDKSAKPNVVYYYQIQDVSLDGEVTTLRTTHLRGNVTATGKATTTWGEIKALR